MQAQTQRLNRLEEKQLFQGAFLPSGYFSPCAPSSLCTTKNSRTRRAGGGCFHVAARGGLCRRDYRSAAVAGLTGCCEGPAAPKRGELKVVPLSLAKANELVGHLHRHMVKAHQHKFSIGLVNVVTGDLVGVAIVAHARAPRLDDGLTAEVVRVATDGTRNACSQLNAAARRIAKAMGFNSIVTYTLPSEGGSSLRGAGWTDEGKTRGGTRNRKSRPRTDKAPTCPKRRWRSTFAALEINTRTITTKACAVAREL